LVVAAVTAKPLEFGQQYQWRVRVWDNNEGVSPWSDAGTNTTIGSNIKYFKTPLHDDPVAAFTKNENVILVNTAVKFQNASVCFDENNKKRTNDPSCTPTSTQYPTCTGGRVCTWKSDAPNTPANAPGARSFWMFVDATTNQTEYNKDETVNPSHQFLSGGKHNVLLTVVDQDGYSSSPATVVLPPAPGPQLPQGQCPAFAPPATNPATPSCTTPSCIQQCVSVQSIEFRRRAP